MAPKEANNPIGSIEKTLRILEVISDSQGVTLDDLNNELPYAKSTIHRHLSTLREHEYVVKSQNSFDISLGFIDLVSYRREQDVMFRVGRSIVDELANRVDERVSMVIPEQFQVVKYYIAESDRSITTDSHLGLSMDMHCNADGKAILAYKSRDYVEDVIESRGLPKKTESTITDSTELFEELAEIRNQGFSFSDQERIPGVRAVAAPVVGKNNNQLFGAVGIAGPTTRLEGDKYWKELPKLVKRSTDEIAVNLEYWQGR